MLPPNTNPAIRLVDPISSNAATHMCGPYELVGEIASGGMGTVYLCRRSGEAGFQRLFALKLMHKHISQDSVFVDMFLDEARMAAQLHHNNAVGIVDLGSDNGSYYVVMQYIEGCSLSEILKRSDGNRSPRLIAPVLIDVLNGLHAAHTLQGADGKVLSFVHRDVSPPNILLGVDGTARITDFGVAKANARITTTRPGILKGKLAYAAPEQLDGNVAIDARADVFAAGAVLWTALTGRNLFRGNSDGETVRRLLNMEIPKPSSIGLRPPVWFDDICLRALQRNRDDRYQSAAEMSEDLRRTAMGAGLLGTPEDVASWVKDVFNDKLEERRSAIRDATMQLGKKMVQLPNITSVTGTASIPMSDTYELSEDSQYDTHPESAAYSDSTPVVGSQKTKIYAGLGLLSLAAIVIVMLGNGSSGAPDVTPSSDDSNTVQTSAKPVSTAIPAREIDSDPTINDKERAPSLGREQSHSQVGKLQEAQNEAGLGNAQQDPAVDSELATAEIAGETEVELQDGEEQDYSLTEKHKLLSTKRNRHKKRSQKRPRVIRPVVKKNEVPVEAQVPAVADPVAEKISPATAPKPTEDSSEEGIYSLDSNPYTR